MGEKDKPYQPSFLSSDGSKPDGATVASLRRQELSTLFRTEEQLKRAETILKEDPNQTPQEIFNKMAKEDSDDPVNDAFARRP